MKNTGSHNGYLRFVHEANGGKSYGNQRKFKVNNTVSTSRNLRAGWMLTKNSTRITIVTSIPIASVSRSMVVVSALQASAIYATWTA